MTDSCGLSLPIISRISTTNDIDLKIYVDARLDAFCEEIKKPQKKRISLREDAVFLHGLCILHNYQTNNTLIAANELARKYQEHRQGIVCLHAVDVIRPKRQDQDLNIPLETDVDVPKLA